MQRLRIPTVLFNTQFSFRSLLYANKKSPPEKEGFDI